VAVKVDREERPDVDAVYMSAVQMLTGGGGWPMTVWRTSERRPFFGRTYFPVRVAMAWPLSRPGVVAPIVGATKLPHLDDDAAPFEVRFFDEEAARVEAPYLAIGSSATTSHTPRHARRIDSRPARYSDFRNRITCNC
jgi:hypothetical protein